MGEGLDISKKQLRWMDEIDKLYLEHIQCPNEPCCPTGQLLERGHDV